MVAVKYAATASPTTDSFAYGDVVPIPTKPVLPEYMAVPLVVHCDEIMPKDDVAYAVYPPDMLPTSTDEEAMEVRPVPPYSTPIEVVAETRPLFAWRGPFNVPRYAEPETESAVVEA